MTQFGEFSLHSDVSGTPAWSPDSQRVAFAHATGLLVKPITQGAADTFVTPPPVASPRWAPAGDQLLYVTGEQVRTVDALGGTAATVPGLASVTAADWQPCALTAVACRSFSPPHCSATTGQVTTQTGQPVDLPPAPCADPASQPLLSHVFVKQPDHGSLAATRYTPNPGFTGQDSVHYRVSNGTGESPEIVKVLIFVVPRPPAASPPPVAKPADATQAPFLSLQVKPRLDRTRSALARLSCDQACTFEVRLTARVKGRKQAVRISTRVKRCLAPDASAMHAAADERRGIKRHPLARSEGMDRVACSEYSGCCERVLPPWKSWLSAEVHLLPPCASSVQLSRSRPLA